MRSASLVLALTMITTCSVAWAQSTSSFDLICPIMYERFGGYDATQVPIPSTLRFKIDITARKYCVAPCNSISPIHKIDDSYITFYEIRDGSGDFHMTANRTTGELKDRYYEKGIGGYNGKGECSRQAFSGFPAQKF